MELLLVIDYMKVNKNSLELQISLFLGEFPWPNKEKPMFFFNLYGVEEISASGTSYLNRTEATQIEKIVFYFMKTGNLFFEKLLKNIN